MYRANWVWDYGVLDQREQNGVVKYKIIIFFYFSETASTYIYSFLFGDSVIYL